MEIILKPGKENVPVDQVGPVLHSKWWSSLRVSWLPELTSQCMLCRAGDGACESPVVIGILMLCFKCSFVFDGILWPFCCLIVSFSLSKKALQRTLFFGLFLWGLTYVTNAWKWHTKASSAVVRGGRKSSFFFQIRYPEDYKKKLFLFCSPVPNGPVLLPVWGPGFGDPCPVWHTSKNTINYYFNILNHSITF